MKHAIIIIALALAACGGGGDFDDEKEHPSEIAPPPCKSVPIEQRQAECGT